MPKKYKRTTTVISRGGQVKRTKSGSKITMGKTTITRWTPTKQGPASKSRRPNYKIPKTPKRSGIGWGP